MLRSIPVVFSFLFVTACAAAEVPQTFDKHYPVQGRAELEVKIGSGNINTRSCGACHDIHLHLEMNGVDRSRYSLEEQQSGNHVRFVLKQEDSHWSWHQHNGKSPEMTIEVPAEAMLDLTSGSGDLSLEGVHGTIGLQTGSGNIVAHGAAGALTLRTGSGDVRANALSGTLNTRSGSGDLRVEGNFSQLDAHTGSGSLNLSAGNLQNGANLSSGSGDVNLRLARTTHADLRVSTGSGSIHSDLPIASQGEAGERHNLNGTLNGGGAQIRISTGSGSVSLAGQ